MRIKTLIMIPVLALALASCGAQTQQERTEGADALALVPQWQYGTPAEYDAPPDFLTDDQQQLFRAAWRMYDGAGGGSSAGYIRDSGTRITVPQEQYDWDLTYDLDTGFATYDDFMTAMHAAFTDDYCGTLLAFDGGTPMLVEQDGKLWALEADRGSNIEYMSVSYELVSTDDNSVTFNMVGHYAPIDDKGEWTTDQAYDETYTIKMEMTDGGWRFASFAIPY